MVKAYYALKDAAAHLDCTTSDLIHLATKGELTLLIGVPDSITFRTYDAEAGQTETPALLVPQLLALSTSQCQSIELNGKTEQSDFRVGYLIAPDGALQRLMPSYGGRVYLDHGWAFWRTYRGPYTKEIELIPERLFVVGNDVRRILADNSPAAVLAKQKKKNNKASNVPEKESRPANSPADASTQIDAAAVDPKRTIAAMESTSATDAKGGTDSATENTLPLIILRMREVQARTGLSRSTIYDKLDAKSLRYDPSFPKRIQLSSKSIGWSEHEINTWLTSRPIIGNSTDS